MPTYPETASAPHLDLTIRSEAHSVVVNCAGRLTAENSALLKTHIKSMLPHEKHLTLDLTALSGMDSSGLGARVGQYFSAKNAKCELQLINLSKPVRQLLGLTNLLSVFESCAQHGVRFP
jgi:anti-sigma B factor antagonist